MKDTYYFQQGIWRWGPGGLSFAAALKSTLQLLALHLLPLLKVAGLALSYPQSIFLPSSTVRAPTVHKVLCEMGTVQWQNSLWFKTKCNFHSISCNTCSCNFRRGWRPRTGRSRLQVELHKHHTVLVWSMKKGDFGWARARQCQLFHCTPGISQN